MQLEVEVGVGGGEVIRPESQVIPLFFLSGMVDVENGSMKSSERVMLDKVLDRALVALSLNVSYLTRSTRVDLGQFATDHRYLVTVVTSNSARAKKIAHNQAG